VFGQINPSFIDSTTVAVLAAFSGWSGCIVFTCELLELTTLQTRRFLFRLPESLSRQTNVNEHQRTSITTVLRWRSLTSVSEWKHQQPR
jgi:hypothetical protein